MKEYSFYSQYENTFINISTDKYIHVVRFLVSDLDEKFLSDYKLTVDDIDKTCIILLYEDKFKIIYLCNDEECHEDNDLLSYLRGYIYYTYFNAV